MYIHSEAERVSDNEQNDRIFVSSKGRGLSCGELAIVSLTLKSRRFHEKDASRHTLLQYVEPFAFAFVESEFLMMMKYDQIRVSRILLRSSL